MTLLLHYITDADAKGLCGMYERIVMIPRPDYASRLGQFIVGVSIRRCVHVHYMHATCCSDLEESGTT